MTQLELLDMTDDDLQATIERLTAEKAARDEKRAEKAAFLADIAERIEAGYVTADEIRAALGDKPKRTRKPKAAEAPVEREEPDRGAVFDPAVHVLVRDLDNQHGIPLIPAMCSTKELLSLTDAMRNETVPAITKAYADKAGFRLKGTLLAAGSTNGGVQDSFHHVQCVSDTHCPSRLTGYCMAEYTCGNHVSAAQQRADEANAPKEEVTDADIEAVLTRGPNVVDANKRILAAYGTNKAFADVLKHEYGEGGGSAQLADGFWGSTWHNAKGLRVSRGDAERLLKWGQVATWTARLIAEGRIVGEAKADEPADTTGASITDPDPLLPKAIRLAASPQGFFSYQKLVSGLAVLQAKLEISEYRAQILINEMVDRGLVIITESGGYESHVQTDGNRGVCTWNGAPVLNSKDEFVAPKCDDCAGDECEPCTPAEPRDADSDECEHGDDLTPIEALTAECNPFADARISKEFADIDCDRILVSVSEPYVDAPVMHWHGEVLYTVARNVSRFDPEAIPAIGFTVHALRPIGAALTDARLFADRYAEAHGLKYADLIVDGNTITLTFEGGEAA